MLPDFETEELGDLDAAAADPASQREALGKALSRAHQHARQNAMKRADAER